MKKVLYLATTILICSCGGENGENQGSSTDSLQTETTETAMDNSILDPAKDDLSGVITTSQLLKSLRIYYDTEIQLIVYPRVYVDGEKFSQGMYGAAEPGSSEYHVSMNFKTLPTDGVKKDQPYLIKGKIKDIGYYDELTLNDVELLDLPTEYQITPFNSKSISGTAIYNPLDIIANMKAWDKKVVTISGDYNGTTISKSQDQTQLLEARADITISGDEYPIGCVFETEEAALDFQAGEQNVKVKGEASYKLVWGTNPRLNNCTRLH